MNVRRLLPLILLSAALAPLGARDFSDHLPAGSLLVFQSYDLPAQREKNEDLPFNKAWEQIDWKRPVIALYEQFLDNLNEEIPALPASGEELGNALETLGERMEKIGAHFSGSLAIAVGDFQDPIQVFREHKSIREKAYQVDGNTPDSTDVEKMAGIEAELEAREMRAVAGEVVFYAEVRDGQDLMKDIAGWVTGLLQEQRDLDIPLALKTLDWEGTPVYTLDLEPDPDATEPAPELPSLWWTVQDGVWTIAGTEAALREALANLRGPVADSLSSAPHYLDSMAFLGEQDTTVYMNLSRMDPLARAAIGEEDLQKTSSPNGKSPAEFLNWMGLDALLPYAIGFRVDGDAMHGTGRLGFSRETPLSRILVEPTVEPAPVPPFLHRDFGQVSSMRWSIPRALRQIEKEASTLDPNVAMGMAMGKGFLTGQLGLDVQTQFLDHLGNGMIFVQEMDPEVMRKMMEATRNQDPQTLMALNQQHPTGGQSYLIGLEVNNLQAVSGALNTLLAKVHPAGPPEPEMFRGHPIRDPMPQNAGASARGMVRYTFLDGYLLIAVGNPELLHKAITASNEPGDRLANDPGFQEMHDRFPGAQMFEYASGEQQAAAWDIISTALGGVIENPANLPDFSPLAEVIRGSISVMERQGTVYGVKSLTLFQDPE